MSAIRIIKHEAVPGCGSFEVLPGRSAHQYFYWDDIPARRLRPDPDGSRNCAGEGEGVSEGCSAPFLVVKLARRTRFPDDIRRANKTAPTLAAPEPPTFEVFFRSETFGRRKPEALNRLPAEQHRSNSTTEGTDAFGKSLLRAFGDTAPKPLTVSRRPQRVCELGPFLIQKPASQRNKDKEAH